MVAGFFTYLTRNYHFHMIKIFRMKMSKNISLVSPLPSKRKTDEPTNDQDILQKKQKTGDMGEITEDSLLLNNKNTEKRIKLKKIAMLLCYSGKNHFGMQRNPGVKTIEEDLMLALLKAGVIWRDHYDSPKNIHFQRAARTDKGVSAVRQIVSFKMPLSGNSEHFSIRINEFLPPEIRVLGIKRVTKGFDAKTNCDARTYSYMLPTFAFSNHKEENSEEFRITAHLVQEINEFMLLFEGTHNYHNFTAGRKAEDPSCKRYIMSCKCGEPFVQDGLEFVIIKMKGQSFMLHQIRKMVGLTIAVIRKLTSVEVLQKAWCNERIDIPIAPGLGLMLEEVHYEKYNQKYGGDGLHEALTWEENQSAIYKFKQEHLLKNIALTEKNERSMLQWLETLDYHTYDVRHSGAPGNHPSDNLKAVELCTK